MFENINHITVKNFICILPKNMSQDLTRDKQILINVYLFICVIFSEIGEILPKEQSKPKCLRYSITWLFRRLFAFWLDLRCLQYLKRDQWTTWPSTSVLKSIFATNPFSVISILKFSDIRTPILIISPHVCSRIAPIKYFLLFYEMWGVFVFGCKLFIKESRLVHINSISKHMYNLNLFEALGLVSWNLCKANQLLAKLCCKDLSLRFPYP